MPGQDLSTTCFISRKRRHPLPVTLSWEGGEEMTLQGEQAIVSLVSAAWQAPMVDAGRLP